MSTTLKKSLVYGLSTGVTLAVTVLFVLFLRRYTDSIGLTLLILALIVCLLSLLYFVSRWYLTEVIGSALASEATRLSETTEVIATANGKIEPGEYRKILGGLLSTARAAGPTVLFVLMAGSLMGAVLVVVGLVNAAVIFQQTEVLERQTQRIDDQNTLIAVQFLNESAQGLRAISAELQALEQARSDLENSTISERALRRILQQVHGDDFDGDVRELICGENRTLCDASIADFSQSFEDEGSYSEFFPVLLRM